MNMDRKTGLLAGFALSVSAACGRPSQAPATAPESSLRCDQGYAVSVVNNTAREVDVWQSTPSGWNNVGSVPARMTSELPLATGNPVQWRFPPEPTRYDPNLSIDVTLHVHCT
jgi:hypothetical protein